MQAPCFPPLLAAWIVGISGLWAGVAAADAHRTSALSWVVLPGAEGCGGAPVIARAVEEQLGRHAIVSPSQADLSIEARADRSERPPLWHAVVVLRDADGKVLGTRELASTADDCSELRSSVALAAALMIDPDALSHPVPPALPALPAEPPPAEPPPPAAPAPTVLPEPRVVIERVEVPVPAVREPAGWRVEPSAAFALGFGILPSVATGVRVGVAVRPSRVLAIEAFGSAWSDQTIQVAPGTAVQFSLFDVGVAACPLRLCAVGRASFTACGGMELALLEDDSQGFAAPRSSLDPAVRGVGLARILLPVSHAVALRASPLVTAEADLGLVVSFP
jgi:hypothetical protein